MKKIFLILSLLFAIFVPAEELNHSKNEYTPSIYLDAYSFIDINFVKDNIKFVNYVLDPKVADIYILITDRSTASGGNEYTLKFKGQHRYEGLDFKLTFKVNSIDTNEVIRENMVQALLKGLYPYFLGTSAEQDFSLKYLKKESIKAVIDPWKNWIFSISLSGFSSARATSTSSYYHLSLNISKTTPKDIYSLYFNYNNNLTDIHSSVLNYFNQSISKSFFSKFVKGINEHFSLAFFPGAENSPYSNLKLKTYIKTAIEYNFIPYSDFSMGKIVLQYALAPIYQTYYDETIYGKIKEMLYKEELNFSVEIIKIWGDANISIFGSNYFHDLTKNQFGASLYFSIRLLKRLKLFLSGNYSFIHDQLALSNTGATDEDILLQKRELETSYNYYFNIGLSYSFGSIYNNIVNTRF
ncbi:hypothetical protein J7L48_03150 [bacterium]|nr:hypothetical protein [bacterium]